MANPIASLDPTFTNRYFGLTGYSPAGGGRWDITPTFVDINGDGLLDMFSGGHYGQTQYFKNTGTATNPAFAPVVVQPFGITGHDYDSRPVFVDIDNDGLKDLFLGSRNSGVWYQKNIGTATAPAFDTAVSNPFGLADTGTWTAPTFADIDGDGVLDLLVGNNAGDILYYHNSGTITAPAFDAPETNPFNLSNVGANAIPSFVDINNDGLLDAFVGNNAGDTLFFRNTGTTSVPVFDAPVTNAFGIPHTGWYGLALPAFADINGDGRIDAFLGGSGNGVFSTFINDTPPTISSVSTFATGSEDTTTPITITFDDLMSHSNVADIDGTVTRFNIDNIYNGTIKFGADLASANTDNYVIDATHNAYWTPAPNVNGSLDAFSVQPVDNDNVYSTTSLTVQVNISAVNDAPTFNPFHGLVTTNNNGYSYFDSSTIQADGKILAGGYTYDNDDNWVFGLVRYNSNGSLDKSFGNNGIITNFAYNGVNDEEGHSITTQADGKILVSGYEYNDNSWDFALVRYNTNGSIDTSFGTNGQINVPVDDKWWSEYSTTIQANGTIVVAGYRDNADGGYDFAIARYHNDGSFDTSFGNAGMLITALDTNAHDDTHALAFQANGKIVVSSDNYDVNEDNIILTRLNSNGSIDTSFGTNGSVNTTIGREDDTSNNLALQADGKIVVSGRIYNGNDNDFALSRYNANGTLDTSFGNKGVVITDFADATDYDDSFSVSIQANGKIVVAGYHYNYSGSYDKYFALTRYNSDGSLDTNFGNTLGNTITFSKTDTAVVLDGEVEITDIDLNQLGNYEGVTLSLARHGGANASDTFNSAAFAGTDIIVATTTIGTVTTNSAGSLLLTFNSDATQELVNSALQQITYSNTYQNAIPSIQLDWTFNDNNTGAQGSGSALNVTDSTTVLLLDADTNITGDKGNTKPVADTLTGYSGQDTLNGYGLNDSLSGGNGNDQLLGGFGNDTLNGDCGDDKLVGDAGADTLLGNCGNDSLDGGLGIDKLDGGEGSDTYYLGYYDMDTIIDSGTGSSDIDTVIVPFQVTSYTLPSSIENGTIAPGTSTYSNASAYGKINATSDTLNGNAKNNVLTGNEGNNTLNGGAGNDVLTGGDGQDTFRFADALANNIDTITDFNPADDSIELSHLVFSRLTTLGTLNSNNFHIGVAADNNDYILYNPSTGVVSYDSDGTGRGAAVSIAILGSHPTLTNSDFIVI